MAKILVVDDEDRVNKLLKEALGEEGYEVSTVTSPDEAMDIILKEPFDLILLDVVLGKESGINFLKKIRKTNIDIPVIIYSGFVTAQLEVEARTSGAINVLRKDLDF